MEGDVGFRNQSDALVLVFGMLQGLIKEESKGATGRYLGATVALRADDDLKCEFKFSINLWRPSMVVNIR